MWFYGSNLSAMLKVKFSFAKKCFCCDSTSVAIDMEQHIFYMLIVYRGHHREGVAIYNAKKST
jgi:hypothetical protein